MQRTATSLSLSNVSKRFGDVDAVHDITLKIHPGEIVGFVGPNGAGKTTTISMLMGYIYADKGTIHILGNKILPETAHKTHRFVGFVAGDMTLPGALTGTQFLTFMAAQNGRDKKQYERLLGQLNPILNRPLRTLSRGNKQKLALIAALQHAPKILILDEPTSGLDPLMQESFLATIRKEATRGATVLMSSHILSEVSSICSRIVFMKSGRFILDQPVGTLTGTLGKHVVITSSEATKLKQFLPEDVQLVGSSTADLDLIVPKRALQAFLRWITTKQFTDILIEERELDDVFHEMYIDKKGKR